MRLVGHEVRVAHDGQAALDTTRDFALDVALLDVALPRIDGLEVARQLRQRYPERPMLLIAVTGFGQLSDRMRTAQAGFDHHLTKPVGFDELLNLMSVVRPPSGTAPLQRT